MVRQLGCRRLRLPSCFAGRSSHYYCIRHYYCIELLHATCHPYLEALNVFFVCEDDCSSELEVVFGQVRTGETGRAVRAGRRRKVVVRSHFGSYSTSTQKFTRQNRIKFITQQTLETIWVRYCPSYCHNIHCSLHNAYAMHNAAEHDTFDSTENTPNTQQ